ncbi:hypothetical protein PVK06_049128 [Gossypium arboreum]|uniref:Uncharacterized protein n=1 Tax=Gossypium arboreum TaxID=29729 RepID=A0ABR0MHR9_GOSAR|nr:hypothetical protein PVK06_049128 [Gossypium arboreum]
MERLRQTDRWKIVSLGQSEMQFLKRKGQYLAKFYTFQHMYGRHMDRLQSISPKVGVGVKYA